MCILIIFLSLTVFSSIAPMQKETYSHYFRFLSGIKRPVCNDDPETFNGNCQGYSQTMVYKLSAYDASWLKLGRVEMEQGRGCTITKMVVRGNIAPYTQKEVAQALLNRVANNDNCAELRVRFNAMQDSLMKELATDHDGNITAILPVHN